MSDTPRLYGPDGRPVSVPKRDLTRRLAAPVRAGFRRAQQWQSVVASLDPGRLRAIYQAVSAGQWCPDYFELAEEIEERDLHYRGVLQQRRLKAAGAPIDVTAAGDAAADRNLADEVRVRVMEGFGWHAMLLDLLDALGKGVSCVEIVWCQRAGRWEPAAYHRIDPRWLAWDDADARTPLLIRDRGERPRSAPLRAGALRADPLEPGKFIYHAHQSKSGLPTRGGLAFSVATLYLLKSVAVRDWWAYAELYGVPVRIGRYGENATDADIATMREALAALAQDAGAAIPDSMTIDVEAAAASPGGGRGIFGPQADWCDAQVSKAVVGQTMTADPGSSRAQAEVHAEVRDDLVRDDARQICETLSQTVVKWYCELNHAPRPAGWPRVVLPQPEADLNIDAIMSAVDRGLRISQPWLRERLAAPEPKAGEEVMVGLGRPAAVQIDENAVHPKLRKMVSLMAEGHRLPASWLLSALDAPADPCPGLQSALDAVYRMAEWGELSDELVEPVRRALALSGTPQAFLTQAADLGVPEGLAADLADTAFKDRVEAEIGE